MMSLPKNPYVRLYEQIGNIITNQESDKLWICLRDNVNQNVSIPTVDEIAMILQGTIYMIYFFNFFDKLGDVTYTRPRDIMLKSTQQPQLLRISEFSLFYDPLQYVLLFSYGSRGCSYNLRIN